MPPPPYVSPPLLTAKEIEVERNKISKHFIKTSLQMSKDEPDAANEFADQKKKKKKKIKDIIDPNPGLFIDDQLKPNEQSFQNTAEKVFNLPPQIQQQLDDTVFKKIIKQPIIQPTSWEIIPNIAPKTEDIFIDDDELDLFKKPESTTTINIGRPKDEEYDDLVMISNDDEVKISKSLIETDTEIKGKDSFKWKKTPENHTKIQ